LKDAKKRLEIRKSEAKPDSELISREQNLIKKLTEELDLG